MSINHNFIATAKSRLAAGAGAALLLTTSFGSLPLALQHASADSNQVICQGDTSSAITFPAAPEQLSPATTSTYILHTDFNFAWTPVSGAASYNWESSYSPDTDITTGSFSRVLSSENTTGTTIDQGDSNSTTYYWHVQAVDSNGIKGAWSATWNVTITQEQATYLGAPTLVSPSNNVIRNETTSGFFFMWNAPTTGVTGTLTYQYESGLSDETDPASGHFVYHPFSASVGSNTYVYDKDTYNGTFYWHVRAIDAAGNSGPWSETRVVQFSTSPRITDTTAPTAVLDITPNRTFQPNQPFNVHSTVTDNDGNNCDYTVTVRDQSGNIVHGPIANTQDITLNTQDEQGNYDLTDGTYTVTLDAWDASGNHSTTTRYIVIDNTAPSVTLTNPTANDILHDTVTITGQATDEHLTSYTLYICKATTDSDGNDTVAQSPEDCWHQVTPSGDSTFSSAVDTTTFANGRYAIVLLATDQSDNISADFAFVNIANTPVNTSNNGATTGTTTTVDTNTTSKPQILTAASITTLNAPDSTASSSVLGNATTQPTKTVHHDHISNAAVAMPNWFSQIWYWLVALLSVLGISSVYSRLTGRNNISNK